MSLDSRPWGLHPRGKGGWWIWDRDLGSVIGWVEASTDPFVNWCAYDEDQNEPVATDTRSLSAAAEALWEAWLVSERRNAPEVPAP